MYCKGFCTFLGLIVGLSGCGESDSPSSSPAETLPPGAPLYAEPLAYCQAKGTADRPGADYTGPAVPADLSNQLRQQLAADTGLPDNWDPAAISWRCMDSQIYACFSLPDRACNIKFDFSRTSTAEMRSYCEDNLNKPRIPATVVSPQSPYSWLCDGDRPSIREQVYRADMAGFDINMWYRIEL